ncbi:MAG: cytidylate kinase family protein [Aliarcobacter sp.]|nr:cytidylate kinase family protein [Aliarcobacter sp.]
MIVGRCANFILKDHPNCINLFIHANNEYRINKINKDYGVKAPFTIYDLEVSDEKRANYCKHFTNQD